jgi:hypothetical protein
MHERKRPISTMRLLLCGAVLTAIGAADAQARPPSLAPYDDLEIQITDHWATQGLNWLPVTRSPGPGIQAAADRLIALQCTPPGGWGWPLTCPPEYHNITGATAMGLVAAYRLTADPGTLSAALDAGDYEQTSVYPGDGEYRASTASAYFLWQLTDVSGDATYRNFAATEFFDELTAGTYGDSNLDTAGWIGAVQAARAGAWINLLPWEFDTLAWTAGQIGNATSGPADAVSQQDRFEEAILDGLDTLDNTDPDNVYSDMIGLAGGVRGLALNGTTSFPAINAPLFTPINGMTTLCELADLLAGYQNANGSWYYSTNLASPGSTDQDAQITAYAILALVAADAQGCGPYDAEIALGRAWLDSIQDASGGFMDPYYGENAEVNGECLDAMVNATYVSLNTSTCATGTTIVVDIDMDDMPVNVVGGQFFLEYSTTDLTLVSVDPGDAPFSREIYDVSGSGLISYAVGVPDGDPGTSTATTMARITFTSITEPCTISNLVSFRASTPPTQLTDALGNPILPTLDDLGPVTIDRTAPTFDAPVTCPLPDITVNADAGTCEASSTTVNPTVLTTADIDDNCDSAPTLTFSRSDGKTSLSDSYEAAHSPITITWEAEDACGNTTTCQQVVTVDAENDLAVDIDLGGGVYPAGTYTRCITFEMWKCSGPGLVATTSATLTFNDGHFSGTVEIECGDYDCITARDTLHTLRRTDSGLSISGGQYLADFSVAGSNALVGGNLNDDDFIDILDFGIFIGQYGATVGASTDCATTGPHADINGDGSVFTSDYTFITNNFLQTHENNCCVTMPMFGWQRPVPQSFSGPITRISVQELRRRGLYDLIPGDLNYDGWLDVRDMEAFAGGARP